MSDDDQQDEPRDEGPGQAEVGPGVGGPRFGPVGGESGRQEVQRLLGEGAERTEERDARGVVFSGRVGSGSHAEQTAGVMVAYEKLCIDERPDVTIVFGDVTHFSWVSEDLGLEFVLAQRHRFASGAHESGDLRGVAHHVPRLVRQMLLLTRANVDIGALGVC